MLDSHRSHKSFYLRAAETPDLCTTEKKGPFLRRSWNSYRNCSLKNYTRAKFYENKVPKIFYELQKVWTLKMATIFKLLFEAKVSRLTMTMRRWCVTYGKLGFGDIIHLHVQVLDLHLHRLSGFDSSGTRELRLLQLSSAERHQIVTKKSETESQKTQWQSCTMTKICGGNRTNTAEQSPAIFTH